MSTFYVAGSGSDTTGTGATGNPWRSLNKAHTQCANGDTIIVRNGTYQEELNITKANTTWRADTGHTPVIDGRYHLGLLSGAGNTITKNMTMPRIDASNYLPGGQAKTAMVRLQAAGVTFDGFVVQNIAGAGIGVGASNVTLRNCVTFCTYDTGIISNPGGNVSGLLIENNIIRLASMKIFDPARTTGYAGQCKRQCVAGSMKISKNTGGTIVRGNDIAWGFAEGLNIGTNDATLSNPIIIENNTIHDINHTYLYVNAARGIVIRNNTLYCTNIALNLWDGDSPVGLRILDEVDVGYTRDLQVYNNLVVNLGYGLDWGARDTMSTNVYVGHNTFVGGPQADTKGFAAIFIHRSQTGVDQRGIFENNAVDYSMTSEATSNLKNATGANGVTMRNNNWSPAPQAAAQGAGDVNGLPRLVRNNRTLVTTNYPTKLTTSYAALTASDNFDPDDYQLTSSSPGRGAASAGGAASGVTPPTALNRDYNGNTRDATPANRDIGAMEFGGVVTNEIVASFSGTPRSGAATLAVTFTDLSTEFGAAVINAWAWDFGDAGTSTSQNPSHNYTAPGTYTVSLTVQDTVLSLTDSITLTGYITVGTPGNAVTAAFSGAPRSISTGHSVAFTDLSVVAGAAVINSWSWNFGDGGTSTSQSPTHVYTVAGTYTVVLTVQDTALGLSDGETKVGYVVVAASDDVHADFSFTPDAGDAPLTIAFTDDSTVDGSAVVDTWLWDFGDGDTDTVQNPSHEYTAAGVYYVTLTVTDASLSLSDSVELGPVVVTSEPDPTVSADFTASGETTGEPGLVVDFIDLSGGPVTTWAWDFGDGDTSTSQNPSHIYDDEGAFDVTLTVTDGASATDTEIKAEFVVTSTPKLRRYVLGPHIARDVETTDGASHTRHDVSDDADTTGAGYLDIATNRPRPYVVFVEDTEEPDNVDGQIHMWFDVDGTLKVKLPGGIVKTLDWT